MKGFSFQAILQCLRVRNIYEYCLSNGKFYKTFLNKYASNEKKYLFMHAYLQVLVYKKVLIRNVSSFIKKSNKSV